MRWILGGALIGAAGLLAGASVAILAPEPAPPTPRPLETASPDDVLDEALALVEAGEAERLADLIHAESPEMRRALDALGRLLGDVQSLGATIRRRFPEQAERLPAPTASPARSAGGSGGFGAMFAELGGTGVQQRLAAILAAPFDWLARSRGRLSTTPLTDDTAAVLVDGRPAFGVGLTMVRTEEGWRVALPLHLPPLSNYRPRTQEEWSILTSMIRALDGAMVDLDAAVRAGEARTLEDVARLAGEKAWAPLAMCAVAYQRAMELRNERGG